MIIKKGTESVSVYFKLIDPTTGVPETGLTITDLDLTYVRDGATAVKADLTALDAVDSAYAANKAKEVDGTNCPGLYRVDVPNAAFVTGVNRVQLCVNGAAIDPAYMEVELVNYDPADGVRLGLTALPNAAADAAGGLPISDAGGLDLDTKLANTNEITVARMGALTDLIDGGRLDLLIDGIKTKTDYLPSATAGQAGGLFIAGMNAATSIVSSSGNALTITSSGGNGCGIIVTGNGLGSGIKTTGGVSGHGIEAILGGGMDTYAIQCSSGCIKTANLIGNVVGTVSEVASVGSGAIESASFASGAITANAIAADAIGASELAADAASKIGTAVWATAARTLTAATNITSTGGTTVPQTGDSFARIGANGASLSAVPWNASWDAEVQSECTDALNAYDPPTKAELDTAVADVSVDEIQASALADLFNTNSGTTYASAVAGSPVKEIADNACGSSLTESGIADAVWNEAQSGHTSPGTFGLYLDAKVSEAGGCSLTAADIADAVWDEASTGHTDAGKAGAQLWTAVDAILADTDELQTDWADGGRLDVLLDAASPGSAGYEVTVTVRTTAGVAISNAMVWASTSSTGSPASEVHYTAANGVATFHLADGTWYFFASGAGYTYDNSSNTVTVSGAATTGTFDIGTLIDTALSQTGADSDAFLYRAVNRVRMLTDEPETNAKYSINELVDLIQESHVDILQEVQRVANTPIIATYTFTYSSSVTTYVLPSTVGRVVAIGEISATSGYREFYTSRSRLNAYGKGVKVEGNVISFQGTNYLQNGTTVTVEYEVSGCAKLYTASTAVFTATTLTAGDALLGARDTRPYSYLGCVLRILPNSGNPVEQERIITGQSGDTYNVYTVSEAFSPALTGTVMYEINPPFSKGFDQVVPTQAAMTIAANEGNATRMKTLEVLYNRQIRTLAQMAGHRDGMQGSLNRTDGAFNRRGSRWRNGFVS